MDAMDHWIRNVSI